MNEAESKKQNRIEFKWEAHGTEVMRSVNDVLKKNGLIFIVDAIGDPNRWIYDLEEYPIKESTSNIN